MDDTMNMILWYYSWRIDATIWSMSSVRPCLGCCRCWCSGLFSWCPALELMVLIVSTDGPLVHDPDLLHTIDHCVELLSVTVFFGQCQLAVVCLPLCATYGLSVEDQLNDIGVVQTPGNVGRVGAVLQTTGADLTSTRQ